MKAQFFITVILFLFIVSGFLGAIASGQVSPEQIKQLQLNLDPQNGLPWGTHGVAKGYHSNFDKGTRVHPTRSIMDYAAYFLASPLKEHQDQGNTLLEKVLALQDQNPASKTFGIWSWYAEEPLTQMAYVDYNWADFQGTVLAVILHDFSDRLSDDIREKAKKSLEYCCRAIIKRNVGPGYTNIAIMGAVVTSAAGELLEIPEFLDYGRKRIQQNLDYYKKVGGFNEYNSPTYTMVVIHELERMLYLVSDSECRTVATELLGEAWKMVAEHYHVPTGEWAGPHARSYGDRLSRQTRNGILFRAGLLPDNTVTDSIQLVPMVPIPNSLRHFFKDIPKEPIERHYIFAKGRPEFEVLGTTWMDSAATLGTATYHTFWEQNRGLIGYWTNSDSLTPVLRLRFLHNGSDFSSAWGRHQQSGTKIISAIGLLKDQGSMHPSFDRPWKTGTFNATSFQVIYQLEAKNATVKTLDSNRFELTAGQIRAVIHVADECSFDGATIIWKTEQKDHFAAVAGVCYEGKEKAFPFREMGEIRIAAGLELLHLDEKPSELPIKFVESDFETKEDGKFYGVLWSGVMNNDKPLLAPLKPTNR
ncbi:MAG: hypothetical protein LBE12_06680 [Planctomycetaceae bacterium]|jgi:hypothetical protein|nr:hypothetical protein [Planctomycetaceae bacterium]